MDVTQLAKGPTRGPLFQCPAHSQTPPPSLSPLEASFLAWAGKSFLARNAHTLPQGPYSKYTSSSGRKRGGPLLIHYSPKCLLSPLGCLAHVSSESWGVHSAPHSEMRSRTWELVCAQRRGGEGLLLPRSLPGSCSPPTVSPPAPTVSHACFQVHFERHEVPTFLISSESLYPPFFACSNPAASCSLPAPRQPGAVWRGAEAAPAQMVSAHLVPDPWNPGPGSRASRGARTQVRVGEQASGARLSACLRKVGQLRRPRTPPRGCWGSVRRATAQCRAHVLLTKG